ncbi:DMT family transporter [Geomonas sp. RF6]|uniref:DMT family transporter n=1 Tax=Geomonas sp. RF6 TaxID=2897342 RepID=UPI001E2C4E4B|nr:DMT family transporter [Geomonas sp. RF6]UFS72441.1 DMT family transporter [Geomonas sp. RF6]
MNLLWLPLTLLSALFLATSDALTKKALARHNDYLVMWLRLLPTVALALPLFFGERPYLSRDFITCVGLALPLEAVAFVLYIKALKLSPLNLTLPFLSLTPVFLLVVPAIVLKERISFIGGAGVLLVAAGSYLLNLQKGRHGVLAPLKAIREEKGSLFMIAVAVIYTFTSTLGKRAIALSSPLTFTEIYLPALALLITPLALYKGRRELSAITKDGAIRAAALPALCYALQAISHSYAIDIANVAYMIAVKRTSLLFGVLYGRVLFREEGRLFSTILMLIGVFLIVIGG